MFILFRMIYTAIYQWFKKKASSAYEVVSLPLRVMPWDCDLNFHINNGRYLSIMDVARFQLYLATGLVPALMKHKWSPVVTSTHLLYRRSVNIFERYDLSSQFIGRTDKFLIVEHRFNAKGKTAVLSYVALAFRDKQGVVASDRLVEAFGLQQLPLDKRSDSLEAFLATDRHFLDVL
ncbi:MAG TPA: acyl-CoA thioesterase [Pseudomonadales bacterium]|nr:acyl-CoA thioesterase [Pseudomonadales bacterium]